MTDADWDLANEVKLEAVEITWVTMLLLSSDTRQVPLRSSVSAEGPAIGIARKPVFTFSKVLVANRCDITVRETGAAKDAALVSVAVEADRDADAPHVRLAEQAFALAGHTSGESRVAVKHSHRSAGNYPAKDCAVSR